MNVRYCLGHTHSDGSYYTCDGCEFRPAGTQHLIGPCASLLPGCTNRACAHIVAEGPNSRFFITMGHPGFNSNANNGSGYATASLARAASQRYAG